MVWLDNNLHMFLHTAFFYLCDVLKANEFWSSMNSLEIFPNQKIV